MRVIACSSGARERGVLPGMLLAEAQSLWPASARGVVRFELHDPFADRQALRDLAVWCQQFSPLVGLDTADTPDCLLLDATGVGDEEEFAENAVDALERRGCRVMSALADTIGAAWGVARYGMLKRPATGGSRVWIVPFGKQVEVLRPLPVEALRLAEGIVSTLHELNVFRVDQLLALPRSGLVSRFGVELLSCIDRAFGALPEMLKPERIVEPLEATWDFEYPIADGRLLAEVIEHLLDWLLAKMVLDYEGVQRLVCTLRPVHHEPISFLVELLRPTALKRNLMELVRLKLERLKLPAEVEALTVRVAVVAPLEFHQDEMFGGGEMDGGENAARELVERLSNRLGEKSVLRPCRQPEAQPEFAYSYEPWMNAPSFPSSAAPRLTDLFRPTLLKNRPVPILVSTVLDGSPRQMHWREQHPLVKQSWGPERIETGWWRGDDIRRDYYVVEIENGERFWVFRNLVDQSWFLHGVFG